MWQVTPPVIRTNTLTHTCIHTHTFFLWSELFILLSTSAASGETLSLGYYKYPQAVANVLTDTGQRERRGPAYHCLTAAVCWCSEWPSSPFRIIHTSQNHDTTEYLFCVIYQKTENDKHTVPSLVLFNTLKSPTITCLCSFFMYATDSSIYTLCMQCWILHWVYIFIHTFQTAGK